MKYIIEEQVLVAVVKAIGDLPVSYNTVNPIINTLTKNITPLQESPEKSALKAVDASETAT